MSNGDTFGARLRMLRISSGKSQVFVANELSQLYPSRKFSQATLSALENRSTAPRGVVLTALAQYFSVSPTYFVDTTPSAGIPASLTEDEMHWLNLYRSKAWSDMLCEIAFCMSEEDV